MLSKSLIQFSINGWACVPSLLFTWGQTMVKAMKIMVPSFKRCHGGTATLSGPDPAAGRCQPTPPLETPGHSQTSLGQSLVGSLPLSPRSWCTQGFICAHQESVSPGLFKLWQLYGWVNGDLQLLEKPKSRTLTKPNAVENVKQQELSINCSPKVNILLEGGG